MPLYEMLEKINSPSDLKKLKLKELDNLCVEIRNKLIEVVSTNGGHLSPNLGVVELTVMLHYVFDSPKDSIVWDVGHQSYTHKMLTGRYDKIDTIRTADGLSSFPKRSESPHDAFNVGHSSTSISAALGIASAKKMTGDNSHTIAVIGDGSFSGGLAYEGCNNAGRFNKNFIVILNDNKMSISKNVGAMARYLTKKRTEPKYLKTKSRAKRILARLPFIRNTVNKIWAKGTKGIKTIVYRNTLFDDLGFAYYGPVDGHDIYALYDVLNAVKESNHPVLLHIVTKKGKGYQYAEQDPKGFHGIGKFDVDSGEPMNSSVSYSNIFGDELCEIASLNNRVCAITAAMTFGTGLSKFSEKFRNRFFDVGIAEQHAVTFACGLATRGLVPVFAVYSSFLQRSYDQLIHDCATQNLHIVLGIDRAGVVGEDGETHQGLFDVAMLNTIPNATVYSPCYYDGLKITLNLSVAGENICAVRYPRGCEDNRPADYQFENEEFDIYGDTDSKILLVTYGRIFSNTVSALNILKDKGINVCILKLCKIKPISTHALDFAQNFDKIFFFEEGILSGGVAQCFEYELNKKGFNKQYFITAVDNQFVQQATPKQSLQKLGLDATSMAEKVINNI